MEKKSKAIIEKYPLMVQTYLLHWEYERDLQLNQKKLIEDKKERKKVATFYYCKHGG